MEFAITWILYNPKLNKTVEAPNIAPLKADSIEEAFKKLGESEFPRPLGIVECVGVNVRQR